MNRLQVLVMMLAMAASSVVCVYADTDDATRQRLVELQEQARRNEAAIASLRAQLDAKNMDQTVAESIARLDNGYAQERAGAVSLKKSDALELSGDYRFRFESVKVDEDRRFYAPGVERDRDRFRQRLRLGLKYTTSDDWEIGVRLSSGDGAGSTSTNDTISDTGPFDRGPVWIDRAYAKKTWGDMAITTTLGQQANPFLSSFILWDSDVNPVGLSAAWEQEGFFVTAGVFDVFTSAGDPNGSGELYMGAAQVGYSTTMENIDATVALGWYQASGNLASDGRFFGLDPEYGYEIGDFYAELGTTIESGGDMGDVSLGIHGHIAKNFGADGAPGGGQITIANGGLVAGTPELNPEDEDLAYLIGMSADVADFSFGYDYVHVEADSVIGILKDSDFGGTTRLTNTDVEGHKFSAGYQISDSLGVGYTLMLVDRLQGVGRTDDSTLHQLDLQYKF